MSQASALTKSVYDRHICYAAATDESRRDLLSRGFWGYGLIGRFQILEKTFIAASKLLHEVTEICSKLAEKKDKMQLAKVAKKIRKLVSMLMLDGKPINLTSPRKKGYGVSSVCRRDESGNLIQKNENTGHVELECAGLTRVSEYAE